METQGRRSFIAVVAGTAFAPLLTWAAAEFPSLLDHFILGCDDLDRGIDFVEKHTGVRAAFGGVHPGRGTRNLFFPSVNEDTWKSWRRILRRNLRRKFHDCAN